MVYDSRHTVGCGRWIISAISAVPNSGLDGLKHCNISRPRARAVTNWRSLSPEYLAARDRTRAIFTVFGSFEFSRLLAHWYFPQPQATVPTRPPELSGRSAATGSAGS